MQSSKHRVGFLIDIDGTLILSNRQIQGSYASTALNMLQSKGIPFLLLTNNVSKSEDTKAEEVNKILSLTTPLTGKDIVLNISPARSLLQWTTMLVLIVGRQYKLAQILPFADIPYFMTVEEYCNIFPSTVPISTRNHTGMGNGMGEDQIRDRVEKRLGRKVGERRDVRFGAILIVACPVNWEESYQVIIDHLSTADGSISGGSGYKLQQTHIPVISLLSDLFFHTSKCNLPRLLIKPFLVGLQQTYQMVYGGKLEITITGKPSEIAFKYAEQKLIQNHGKIEQIAVIGDNEETDIVGGKSMGWHALKIVREGDSPSKIAQISKPTIFQAIQEYLMWMKCDQL